MNLEEALVAVLIKLGGKAVNRELVGPTDAAFKEVLPTTWKALEDKHLVKAHRTVAAVDYELTGSGWLAASEITGEINTPAFQKQFGDLSAALKRRVDGRLQEQSAQLSELAQETGLSENWIYNVIKAQVWYHRHRAGPEFDDSETLVWIPIDFGSEPL